MAFYTDKASLFQTAEKRKRDATGVEKDRGGDAADADRARVCRNWESPWIAAHSPQAKGRVERNFGRRRIVW